MKKYKFMLALLLLTALPALTQAKQIQLRMPDTTVVVGQEFLLPVYADSSLTGEKVTSYQFSFEFYAPYFRFKSVETAGSLTASAGMSVTASERGDGRVSVAAAGANSLSGRGVLFYLRIAALKPASYAQFNFYGGTDENLFNEGMPGVILKNSRITVQEKPYISVSPNSLTLTTGDTEQFYAYYGTAPYQWFVTNPSVAEVSSAGVLRVLKKGFTRVYAVDKNGLTDTMDGGVEIRGIKLSLRDTSQYANTDVLLPVYINDITDLNIISGKFSLEYNADVISALDIVTENSLLSGAQKPGYSVSQGKITLAFALTKPIQGAGVLLFVKFRTSKALSGSTYVSVEDGLFNEDLLSNYRSCYFSKKTLSDLDITYDQSDIFSGDTLNVKASGGLQPYIFSLNDSSLASIGEDGTLIAKSGGSLYVTLTDATGFSRTSGRINIYDVSVHLPDTTALSGDTVSVPVYYDPHHSGKNVYSFEATVLFNKDQLTPLGFEAENTMSLNWSVAYNDAKPGEISIASAGAASVQMRQQMIRLRFRLLSASYKANLEFGRLLLNEGSPVAFIDMGGITPVSILEPSGLTAVSTVPGRVELKWTDRSENEEFFRIERQVEGSGSFYFLANAAANSTAYTDTLAPEGKKCYYRLAAGIGSTYSAYSNIAGVSVIVAVDEKNRIPSDYLLKQNYPNPFNPSTVIEFSLPEYSFVSLSVYDILGNLVKELAAGPMAAGTYHYELNTSELRLSSGVYIYKLQAGKYRKTLRMLLLK